jgi:hypothetical protein
VHPGLPEAAYGPIKYQSFANTVGELVDLLTVAAMAASLRERVSEHRRRACCWRLTV